MNRIDLADVRLILSEADALVNQLDGQEFDDSEGVADQASTSGRRQARAQRAAITQKLNLLTDRLRLASELVRNEYHVARGRLDPLDPTRNIDEDGLSG